MTADETKIRIGQWATGTVGTFAMRAVVTHPDMELVAVRVYSAAKEGRDAGRLCGLPDTGVKATRTLDSVLAAKPDCVVYMPEATDVDDVCAMLSAGINIVTTRAEFFNPDAMAPSLREAVESACLRGQSSIHATGSSPGFVTEALPLVVMSLVRRLDFLAIEEYANCLEGCSEEMLTELMGFGDSPTVFAQRNVPDRDQVFEHSLALVASAIGLPIERFDTTTEIATCRNDTPLHSRTIPAGSVGGQRVAVVGYRDGRPLMRFRSNWFVTMDLEPAWDLRGDGWRLTVEGDTPVDMVIDLPMPIAEDERASGRYTAHRPVNVIPAVIAAPPGIIPSVALPFTTARLA